MKRFAIGALFLAISAALGWSQQIMQEPYWYTMERGKQHFQNGAYGDALLAFEEARYQRRMEYAKMEQDMIALLSMPEVRYFGDSLMLIELYIADRHQINAAQALEELYYRVPRAEIGGSARRALEYLDQLKSYPEAEYWIGETYRSEGELGIALGQYQKAYDLRSLLATPGFEVEILYRIADIHRVRQEYSEMERVLEEILAQDPLWSAGANSFVRLGMSRSLENEGIARFLTLYRHNNPLSLRAHELLGYFYFASGRHSRAAEHLMFVFLIQNSILISELINKQYDYTFVNLNALLQDIQRYPALSEYVQQGDYYKTMYYLGAAYYDSGKTNLARDFWTVLNGRAEAGEWRIRAQNQLRNPFIEEIIEMP